jgi:hypothetical protein
LISSIVMSATSLKDVSLMAIVPDSEWRMPTLMVSPDPEAAADAAGAAALGAAEADEAVGAGAVSSLLQPSDPSWLMAASAMSHFRMTCVTPRVAISLSACFRQLSARCLFGAVSELRVA